MEKSIESIWKQGFLDKDALVAPIVNDLYKQKSKHIIDKFKRIGKMNLYGIVIGAVILFTGSFFVGIPYVGAFVFVILIGLVYVGKNQASELEKINNSDNTYLYLKAFDSWLKASISEYSRIYRYVYPLLFLAFIIAGLYSNIIENDLGEIPIDIIMNGTSTYLLFGIPVFLILPVVLIMGLVSYFSGKLYKLDLNSLYGGVFKKLDEILTDMEDLRR